MSSPTKRGRSSTVGAASRPAERPISMIESAMNNPLGANPGPDDDDDDGSETGSGNLGFSKLTRYGGTDNLLASAIANRPTREELVNRNILKPDNIAPRLQQAQEELKKKQLESFLGKALEKRSDIHNLIEHNIIKQDPQADVEKRQQIQDTLAKTLGSRPQAQELVQKDILKPSDAPAV